MIYESENSVWTKQNLEEIEQFESSLLSNTNFQKICYAGEEQDVGCSSESIDSVLKLFAL